MTAFLDTNVAVYAYDAGEPEKRATARTVIGEHGSGDLVVSSQVMAEFYWVATRRMAPPLDPTTAEAAAMALSRLTVVPVDGSLVISAIRRAQAQQLASWDAMIIEAAIRGGCDTILSEDLTDGQEFDGVTVVNPFAG